MIARSLFKLDERTEPGGIGASLAESAADIYIQ
jgi:hypothetical protein